VNDRFFVSRKNCGEIPGISGDWLLWLRSTSALNCANPSRSSGSQRNAILPVVELAERQFALQPMPLLTIADLLVQRRQQIKGDIRRLEIPGISVCHVVGE
jgi:hypothetical protein